MGAIDWRNEFDPKKYKHKAKEAKGSHSSNATFVETQIDGSAAMGSKEKKEKKSKRSKKKKQKNAHPQTATNIAYSATANVASSFAPYRSNLKKGNSATASRKLAHEQRWSGFGLGASGDEEPETHDSAKKGGKGSKGSVSKPKHRDKPNNMSIRMDL